MASVKDIEQVTDDLDRLVGQLRSEIRNGPDFVKLVEIVDEISEHADNAAQTFSSVNETLMSRIGELSGKGRSSGKSASSSGSQAKT